MNDKQKLIYLEEKIDLLEDYITEGLEMIALQCNLVRIDEVCSSSYEDDKASLFNQAECTYNYEVDKLDHMFESEGNNE
jgi:hypothetical protein